MKKIITLIGLLLIMSVSFAESLNPDLEIVSQKLVSCTMEKAIGTFEVRNNSDIYNSDIYYILSLNIYKPSIAGKEYEKYFKFAESKPVRIDIGAKETKNITFEYYIPEEIPQNKYSISIQLYSETMPIGYQAYMDAGLLGTEEGYLDRAQYEHWKIGKELIDALDGPNITAKDKPLAMIGLKSNFTEDKEFIPEYTIYSRNQIYAKQALIDTYTGAAITIKAGETKNIELEIPVLEIPESYYIQLVFRDAEDKQVSSIYEFRYVLVGASAKILSMNSKYNELEDKVDISINVVGPADASDLEGVEIAYNIYNSADNRLILEEKTVKNLTKDINIIKESIDASSIEGSFDIIVEMSYDNKILAVMENTVDISKTKEKVEMFSDLVGTKYLDAVKILNGLNILNGYPDGTFKPENPITRAEFTVIATKLAKLDVDDIKSLELRFNDISSEHWAKNFIILAYENGIISGYPDGTFKPDNNVTYQEALTILLNVMGYKWDITKSKLGWPQGYIQKANELNMMNKVGEVDYTVNASRGDVALLTFAAYLRLAN